MVRAITPKAMDDREGFEMNGTKGKKGFTECKGRMDNEVEGYYGNPRFLVEPLEVMFCPYLNRGGFGEREMGSRAIEGTMMKLSM